MSSSSPPLTWMERNERWVVPLGCLLLLLLVASVIVAVVSVSRRSLHTEEASSAAIDAALAEPAVVAALGDPVEPGLFMAGSLSDDQNAVEMQIPLRGSEADGTVYATAEKRGGRWVLTDVEVRLADGRTVAVATPPP